MFVSAHAVTASASKRAKAKSPDNGAATKSPEKTASTAKPKGPVRFEPELVDPEPELPQCPLIALSQENKKLTAGHAADATTDTTTRAVTPTRSPSRAWTPKKKSPAAEKKSPAAEKKSPAATKRFGRGKDDRAKRLARVLVSDILCYNQERRDQAIQDGNLMTVLGEEIRKSWDLYKEKVGADVAGSTNYFKEALNEILADGQEVF